MKEKISREPNRIKKTAIKATIRTLFPDFFVFMPSSLSPQEQHMLVVCKLRDGRARRMLQ
jgi:hypothetical protein